MTTQAGLSYREVVAQNYATIQDLVDYAAEKTTAAPRLSMLSKSADSVLAGADGRREVVAWLASFAETYSLVSRFVQLARFAPMTEDAYRDMAEATSRMLTALRDALEDMARTTS